MSAVVLGCAKATPEDKVAGGWTGDPPFAEKFTNDPNLHQMAEFFKDSVELDIRNDHTYVLRFGGLKRGTWKLAPRRVDFEETYSQSPFQGMDDFFAIGSVDASGKRKYSAVISADDRKLTILLGRDGKIVLHR